MYGFRRGLPVQGSGAQYKVPRIGIGSLLLLNSMPGIHNQFGVERSRESANNLALRPDEITAISVEVIGPDVRTRFRFDKLHIDLNPITKPPNTAFEHIVDPKVATNLLHIEWFALVGEGGGTSDYEAIGNP